MKRVVVVALAVLGVWACGRTAGGTAGEAAGTAAVDRDTLTRRQKDSIVSTMPIPGASKIGDAQRAVDKINANTHRLDTVR
jgi:hypothetical protein